jgi:hypothetical protein
MFRQKRNSLRNPNLHVRLPNLACKADNYAHAEDTPQRICGMVSNAVSTERIYFKTPSDRNSS